MDSLQHATPLHPAVQSPAASSSTREGGESGKACLQCGRLIAQAAKCCTNCGIQFHQQQLTEQLPPQVHLHVQPSIPSYPSLVRPTPPPRQRWRPLWLVVSIVTLVLLSRLGTLVLPTSKSIPASPSQLTPLSPIPTWPPTQAPTPTLKTLQSAGPMLLGENIETFIETYGPAASHIHNYYVFVHPAVDIMTGAGNISTIFVSAPATAMWNVRQAESICLALAPPDRVYKRTRTILDAQGKPTALQKVYYSVSLSKHFPSSYFTDENAKQTTPGTFSLVLLYDRGDPSKVLQCNAQVGLQHPS